MRRLKELLNWQELKREPPPRGAIAIVVVGLIAIGLSAYVQSIDTSGEAAHLEWVQEAPVADSDAVAVPGGDQKMKLTGGLIRATGTNTSGYSLFQVVETLRIEAGAPIGDSRILCTIGTATGTEISQTYGGLRALYPRSSEGGIYSQEVPERLSIDFSSHGQEYAYLEVGELTERWTTERGVKLEWPQFEKGTEHLKYFITGGPPKNVLRLPFYSIWRATGIPKAAVSCTLETSAGKAIVKAKPELKKVSPPIDEEAEAENLEAEEAEEEESDEAGGEGE